MSCWVLWLTLQSSSGVTGVRGCRGSQSAVNILRSSPEKLSHFFVLKLGHCFGLFLNVSLWQPCSLSQTASSSLGAACSPTPAPCTQGAVHCQTAMEVRGVRLPQSWRWSWRRVGSSHWLAPAQELNQQHPDEARASLSPWIARSGQTAYLLGCTDYLDPIWITSLISKVSHGDV